MKSFLNYLKIILLNILQNDAIYLFKCFVLHITAIPQNETFLYYRANQISLKLMRPLVAFCWTIQKFHWLLCFVLTLNNSKSEEEQGDY